MIFRNWFQHVERIFHEYDNEYIRKNDSGFYMHPQDRHSPDYIRGRKVFSLYFKDNIIHFNQCFFTEYVPQMSSARRLERECDDELYCGMPFYLNTFHSQRQVLFQYSFNSRIIPCLHSTAAKTAHLYTYEHKSLIFHLCEMLLNRSFIIVIPKWRNVGASYTYKYKG